MRLDSAATRGFRQTVWDYYHDHGRHDLPWRQPEADGSFDLYKILVSEVMLQQTQVGRVTVKYREFLRKFPNFEVLAQAELGDVLRAWSGLGYNRRAKYLWQAAGIVLRDTKSFHAGDSDLLHELVKLPGVGMNTAGAVAAYTYNVQVIFVETNIRTVFIHHFFHDDLNISDSAIRDLVEQTLDREHPREWYWALMDYGAFLKQTVGNLNRSSKHYTKQSKFAGSKRQIRGEVLRQLAGGPKIKAELTEAISDDRLTAIIDDLLDEDMIRQKDNKLML